MLTPAVRTPVFELILDHMCSFVHPMYYLTHLLECGARPPSTQTVDEREWLIQATKAGKKETVAYLLTLGANPDAEEKFCPYSSARHYAITRSHNYFDDVPQR